MCIRDRLDKDDSRMFSGNQIQPQKTVGALRSRRWVADYEDGLQKIYYKENIVARIYAMADWFSPSDVEAPTLEWVVFSDRKTFKPLKIREIPDVLYSEVMRDVDLAVSVAHAGGVDPETSHSTVVMRKAIEECNLELFKIKNVRLEGSHAFIDGKLGQYTVHLGKMCIRDRFQTIAVLSHDLRTPLTVVMSYLQFIKDGQYIDNSQLRLYAERAFDKANTIKDLSDSLFNSCISDAEKTNPLERVEGANFLSNALSDIESLLVDCGFEVRIKSFLDDCIFYISVDYDKMSRMFENLISNIRKYADDQYPVEFELELIKQDILLRQVNKIHENHEKNVCLLYTSRCV